MHTKLIKLSLFVLLLASSQLSFAAVPLWHDHSRSFIKALAKALEQQTLVARQKYQAHLPQVVTEWEKCEVVVSRRRVGPQHERVRVRKSWTCKTVTTTCAAALTEKGVAVESNCYYPKQDKEHDIKQVGSYLVQGENLKQKLNFLYETAEKVLLALS